jgi:hypothetical protein
MPKFKNVLQIKVALKNFKPTIFRTFYFPANLGFLELHAAIQEVMGWMLRTFLPSEKVGI